MAGVKYVKFIPQLTKRELEVIEVVLAGASKYKSIASSLNISVNTVKTHLRNIYQTVGVNNTDDLASLFHGYSSNITDFTPKSPQKNNESPQIGDGKQSFFAVIFYNIIQSGGKKMEFFKALRIRAEVAITFVLIFALVMGLTAKILVSKNMETSMEFGVTAEPVPEGILLTFNNIPEDTTDISLTFVDINAKDQPETVVIVNYEALDEMKKTGNLLCPFAEKGKEYLIRVYRLIGVETDEKIVTGAVAGGGIYLTNTPLLHFTDDYKSLILSEMPEFSDKVVFSTNEYLNYYTYVRRDNGWFIGIGGDATNSLTSYRSVQLNDDVARMYSHLLTNNMPMYGTAHCLLKYKNMEWIVQVAQSEDVIVAF